MSMIVKLLLILLIYVLFGVDFATLVILALILDELLLNELLKLLKNKKEEELEREKREIINQLEELLK